MKATAKAPSNIAFIKYWGKKDETLRLPENGSISVNLSGMDNEQRRLSFRPGMKEDEILYNDKSESTAENRAIVHLDRIGN